MIEKYCVVIPNVKKRHEFDTVAVLLEGDKTLNPIRTFNSVDEAVHAAREDKIEHPDQEYEIRIYYGTITNVLDIEKYGRWGIGVKVVRRV